MPSYWMKEIPEECFLPDGKKINVDFIGVDGMGWLSTGVGYLNHQIGIAVKDGIGGWVEATQEQYESELKKKAQLPESPRRNNLYRANQPLSQRNAGGVAKASSIEVPVPPKPDPIRVPTADQMRPRKGPIPKEAFI